MPRSRIGRLFGTQYQNAALRRAAELGRLLEQHHVVAQPAAEQRRRQATTTPADDDDVGDRVELGSILPGAAEARAAIAVASLIVRSPSMLTATSDGRSVRSPGDPLCIVERRRPVRLSDSGTSLFDRAARRHRVRHSDTVTKPGALQWCTARRGTRAASGSVIVALGLDNVALAIASAREQFLHGEQPCGPIRDEIVTSWRRSALSGADPDVTTFPYSSDLDLDGRLARAPTRCSTGSPSTSVRRRRPSCSPTSTPASSTDGPPIPSSIG